MQNHLVTLETLPAIVYHDRPVITTDILATVYGTEPIRIQQNHNRNECRFTAGKHFFKVTGKELSDLRLSLSESQISPKTRSLTLWTERGAARHAKMLDTDQAWDVFERLEDCYFAKYEHRAVGRIETLGDLAGTASLSALVDKLQQIIHEGEFIPAGKRSNYSLPANRKHEQTIIKEFLNKDDSSTLMLLLEWLRADGFDMSAADRELDIIRCYVGSMRRAIGDIQTHARYIDHQIGKL